MMALDTDAARASIRVWIEQQHGELERSSYYTILGVDRSADEAEVRSAYYRLVARFHPDLYGDQALDPETRSRLVTLYSRLVESYRVLSDPKRRRQYDKLLEQGRLRLTHEDEHAPKREPEAEIANASARRFFKLGKAALLTGDAKQAAMNFKLALSAEPGSSLILAELAKLDKEKGNP
jgi:DnaJ-class molecular chaperone